MEATHKGMVVGVNRQLGERKCFLPILLDPFPVEAGDGKWFAGGHSDRPAHMRWLFPVWFEEADHWDEAKLRLCPSRLVRPQLANGLGTGVHRREALAGWHVPLGDESVVAGQTLAVAGVVMNNDGANIVLVEFITPVVAVLHGSAEEVEARLC